MKLKLSDSFKNEYPKIIPIDLEITVGDGWYWLIDKLCYIIQFNIEYNDRPQLQVEQIKQKLGGLRFRCAIKPHISQREQIYFAEFLSYRICEKCGTTVHVGFDEELVRTLCKKCTEFDFKFTFTSKPHHNLTEANSPTNPSTTFVIFLKSVVKI